MKAILNENWIEVEQGFVLVSDRVAKTGELYLTSIKRDIKPKSKGVIQAGDTIEGATFLLQGVPLIVLEYEVTKLSEIGGYHDKLSDDLYKEGFHQYNSKYKYTEEDLKNAIELARPQYFQDKNGNTIYGETYLEEDHKIIEILNKPKTIEFEIERDYSNRCCESCCLLMDVGLCDADKIGKCVSNTGNEKHADYWSSRTEDESDYEIYKLKVIPHPTHKAGQLIIK
jgi:hypothetical protein